MKKKIILNMIVKNESHIIQRCLASVRKLIGGWVIVDTGSTDGTQETIRNFFHDLPGELHERPWVNFEHNRNEAMELAKGKGDYLLIMDADDFLEISDGFNLPDLDQDGYLIAQKTKEPLPRSFIYLLMIKNSLPWNWSGLLHEELVCEQAVRFETLRSVTLFRTLDGNRSRDSQKLHKDIETLKEAHRKEPSNSRYVHFLAITCETVHRLEEALSYYEQRLKMGGWDEEIFYAHYKIADLQRKLGKSPELFLKSYGRAHQARPTRAEPLYWLTSWAISQQNFSLGYLSSKQAISIPFPEEDTVYVESWIYEYGALMQFVKCSAQMKLYDECLSALEKLKALPSLPAAARIAVEEAYPFIRQARSFSVDQRLCQTPLRS